MIIYAQAYDPKKSVWVPNPDKEVGGYFEGLSEEEIKYDTFTAGKKLQVNVKGEVKTYKADTVCQVNPAKVMIYVQTDSDRLLCSLTALRIWLISPSSVTPAFSGTLSSGTRTS